jgi:DNA polymerase (family 10)
MPVRNTTIAETFSEIADILEIEDANPFRVRAYRNAARTIAEWPENLSDIYRDAKDLPHIPGVGADLKEKIIDVISSGHSRFLDEMRRKNGPGIADLLRIPAIGPHRVRALKEKLGITDLKTLRTKAEQGEIRKLAGFSEKLETKIITELDRLARSTGRLRFDLAEDAAKPLIAMLSEIPKLGPVTIAGSFRRRAETVGDLDLLAVGPASAAREAMKRFVEYDEVEAVLSRGQTRSSIRLHSGLNVDLRIVAKASYGAALLYFTGSKTHNIALRTMGMREGLKINEYGVFKGKRRLCGATEEEVFQKLGLPYIEPELREARGEIDAAKENKLPKLIQREDIRGDLHSHTNETDGRLPLEKMVEAAQARGHEYLAITDHSKRLTVARGLDCKRLRAQMKQIDVLNGKMRGFHILKGIEVDILEDGSLDLDDETLAELDIVIASVHYKFNLTREKQTERILRAMDNRLVKIIAHPSGRLIGRRDPYDVDMLKIIEGAKARGCFLELNSQPDRLDLNDIHCLAAKRAGVKISIDTDSHADNELDFLRYGIAQARRGWLEPADVLNTRPLAELMKLLRR